MGPPRPAHGRRELRRDAERLVRAVLRRATAAARALPRGLRRRRAAAALVRRALRRWEFDARERGDGLVPLERERAAPHDGRRLRRGRRRVRLEGRIHRRRGDGPLPRRDPRLQLHGHRRVRLPRAGLVGLSPPAVPLRRRFTDQRSDAPVDGSISRGSVAGASTCSGRSSLVAHLARLESCRRRRARMRGPRS